MRIDTRLLFGSVLNQCLLWPLIAILAAGLMDLAGAVTGDRFSWPLIGFMSTYPEDVRNGYLLFAAAVFGLVFLFSGILAAILGASPGKALLGVRYERRLGGACSTTDFLRRGVAMVGLLVPIFLLGPALGFLLGPAADTASLVSLFGGVAFAVWTLGLLMPGSMSPLNRFLDMHPVRSAG